MSIRVAQVNGFSGRELTEKVYPFSGYFSGGRAYGLKIIKPLKI